MHADEVQALFDAGSAAYDAQNYEEAVTNLQQVVDYDERYSDGYALYYLARSYENLGQNDQALEMFQRFAAAYPGTQRATYSNNAIARLQQAGAQTQDQTETDTGTDTQNQADAQNQTGTQQSGTQNQTGAQSGTQTQ